MTLLNLTGEPSKVVAPYFPERFHKVALLASILFPTSICGAGSPVCLWGRSRSVAFTAPDADLFPWYQVEVLDCFAVPGGLCPPASRANSLPLAGLEGAARSARLSRR